MEIELLLSFLAASILLSLMPGPDNIFVLTESISKGKRHGIAISIGLNLGVLTHTFAAATGLSILIQSSDIAFNILKYAGASYLFYLTYLTFKEDKIAYLKEDSKDDFHFYKLVKKGFLMNILNPKVSLFFIAFLPKFISISGFNITLQMIILGFIFMIQSLFIFIGISYLSGQITPYLKKDNFWKATKYIKASVLFILGIFLLI